VTGICKEFVPLGQTVNQTFYIQVLERLRNRVRRVRGEISDKWFLYHDNAPSHTSFAVRKFLAQNKITTIPHPPYSLDVALCDFILFPKLKTHLKGHNFETVENVSGSCDESLNIISIEDILHCYKSGSNAGIAVFDRKEPNLKGINCNCMYVQYFFFESFSLILGPTSYTSKHSLRRR
jgi:hypothetical protein